MVEQSKNAYAYLWASGFHHDDTWPELGEPLPQAERPSLDLLNDEFVRMVAAALDERGLSPKTTPPFPEFSFGFIVEAHAIFLIYGASRTERVASYRDTRNAVPEPTLDEAIETYQNAFAWPVAYGVSLPAEVTVQSSDEREALLTNKASQIARQIEMHVNPSSDIDEELCFIIMSFSGNPRLKDFYSKAIRPTVKRLGYKCQRVDEQQFNDSIRQRILDNIRRARFIIADMTEARPNCYYELGIAHALGKEVIHITSDSKDIHFDIRDFNFIVYEDIDGLKKALRLRIRATIGEHKQK